MSSARILLLPGIGDIHWVLLKLHGFCEKHGITDPELWIWDFDGRRRGLDYLEMIPWVRAGGYWTEPLSIAEREFRDVYMTGVRDVIPGFQGFDYLFAVNGSLRVGRTMAQIMPDIPCDWDYPIRLDEEELRRAENEGPYALLYFSHMGMFSRWLRYWPVAFIRRFILQLSEALPDTRLLLTGSSWDRQFTDQLESELPPGLVWNGAGRTSLSRFLALVKHARFFAGWCGGNTIVSTHLGTPTVILWSQYFRPEMQINWADPKKVGRSYFPLSVETVRPNEAARVVLSMLAEEART